jgi:Protein of unknown function (DUF2946)
MDPVCNMRRRCQKYLPIVLIALMVQIFAPIGVCWAAAMVASDPLATAEICHDSGTAGQAGDQNGQQHEHGGACAICCLASAGASVDTPSPVAVAHPYRATARVVWHQQAADLSVFRGGSNAQARAPPFFS